MTGPVKDSCALALCVFEDNAHRVRVSLVAIDQHQRPVAIGTMHSIGRYQQVALTVFDIGGSGEHQMHTGSVLHPFQIDHVRARSKARCIP